MTQYLNEFGRSNLGLELPVLAATTREVQRRIGDNKYDVAFGIAR